ncbi:MAG: hypothetical protein ABI687_13415 [Flavitalea sp.]
MSKSDKLVIIILSLSILLHVGAWMLGLWKHKLLQYISPLNAVVAIGFLGYWIQNELRITQHYIETREIVFLSLESLILVFSIYSLIAVQPGNWVRITHYVIFSLNLTAMVLFLIFMANFKITKLF